MSQNQLIRKSDKHIEDEDEEYDSAPVIDVFEPEYIPPLKTEEKLKKFYQPLEFPFCGDYPQPDLREVELKKKQNQQIFAPNQQNHQKNRLIHYDGAFYQNLLIDENTPEIIRQKARMARDGRIDFFEDTGEFVVEKQFFQEQLAGLANISFDQNMAIKTFHKNAILSERNNQKKSTSFQLVLNFGSIFLTKHPLQNEEQRKFEELRPLLKEWSIVSAYPVLPQLAKEIDFLEEMKQNLRDRAGEARSKQELKALQRKLKVFEDMYAKERRRMQELAKSIITKWKQLKQIRLSTGMQTVPWKINIKEYEVPGQKAKDYIKNYDIGLSQIAESSNFTNANSANTINQKNRRSDIQKEVYFIRVFINDNQVAKTDKFKLEWPSFEVPIHKQISITVYSAPYKVSIEIVKNGFINQVIDAVTLNLPGLNSKTITASQKKFAIAHFASNGKQTRTRKDKKQESKAPSGILLYMMEWKGQGSRMPPSIFAKIGDEDTRSTEVSEDFSDKLSDIEVTQKDVRELFDVRDPRLQQKTLKDKVEDEINEGSNALLPFVQVQSTRLLFLRLRNRISDLEKIQIPLLEEEFEKRENLREILEKEKRRNRTQIDDKAFTYFHPCENKVFSQQTQQVLSQIRSLLTKVQGLKLFTSSRGLSLSTMKYKNVQEIINEHIFEQMQSPIVVFFKDLFTQKRKLGPKNFYKAIPKTNFDEIEINLHVRSAKNLPIRSGAEQSVIQFEKRERMLGGINMGIVGAGMYPPMGGYASNNRDMYANYGTGLFNQNPTFSMTGHTYFHQNQGNPNRINQEVSYEGKSMERVNTVIQLRFKKNLKRTQSFEGPFPEWNETLTFSYNLKKEDSSIEKVFYNNQKIMKVMLFDITEESRQTKAIGKILIKKTKYYLGRIEIPLSLITVIPSLSGLWKLDRPLIMFSYGMMGRQLFADQNNQAGNPSAIKIDSPSMLNLDMFTQPIIDSFIANNADRKFMAGPSEESLLLQKASDWLEDLNTKRYVKLWLNDINLNSIFICRFLSKNIAPPSSFTNYPIERTARFVSMIPRKYNCHLLQNTEEFHLNVDEFLKLKMGQDHGILLCNYFNFIDSKQSPIYQSYLILGKAFPYGKVIFVLRRDKDTNNCEIWDPFRGQCYAFRAKQIEVSCFCIKTEKKQEINSENREICPLFEATCIVSKDNVFVNRQESTNPYLMEFNLEDSELWTPFLTERTRKQYYEGKQIPTIQPEMDENYYKENFPQKNLAADIQKSLYDFITGKIQYHRVNHFNPLTYKINQRMIGIIKSSNLLGQCEIFKNQFRMMGRQSKFYERQVSQAQNALAKLEEAKKNIKDKLESDKKFYGYTMNFTFTTNQQIWEKIEDTQIHLDQTQQIQFVLSIKCDPQPCHLFSVWVFIGTIE